MDPYPQLLPPLLLFAGIIAKPFSISVAFALLGMLLLLVLTTVISAAESAFFSLDPGDIETLKNTGNKKDSIIIGLTERPKRLLATLLVSLNFVNIAIVILSTFVMTELFDFSASPTLGFVIQVIAVTFLILIIGEIIPKVYAIQNPLPATRLLVLPTLFFEKVFYPVSSFLIFSTSFIDKHIKKKTHNISVEELSHALDLTTEQNVPEDDQKLLQGIVKFGDTDVKQIMQSRVAVTAFDHSTPYPELIKKIEDSVYSRIPVYKQSFDNVVGVLYIKDILPHLDKQNFDWQTLLRPPFFVPESKKIDDLLREFQHNKIHLAIVVDEYGGTSGIVSLEDIIEEIIGEINDEFDDDDIVYSKLDAQNYVFEGKIPLKDVYRVLNLDGTLFEESKGESDTLAGFLIEHEGRILARGEKVHFNNIIFTVEAADPRKIKRVKITLPKTDDAN
jgi:putative hemolysin